MIYNTDINIIGSIPDYHLIIKALPYIYRNDKTVEDFIVRDNEFNLRTEKSRKRFLSALNSGFITDNKELNNFVSELLASNEISDKEKKIILFWLFHINNRLFGELNNRLFLKSYYQGRAAFPSVEVEAFLRDLTNTNPELENKWSTNTIKTIASKYLTILMKLNLLDGSRKKKFCFIGISDELILCLIKIYTLLNFSGKNFLEHEFSKLLFISNDNILERLKKISKRDWINMNFSGVSLKVETELNTNTIVDGIFRRS